MFPPDSYYNIHMMLSGMKKVHTSSLGLPHFDKMLASGINEHVFFHGTKAHARDAIVTQGLDFRMASGGRFGRGVYLAEHVAKSHQYSGKCNLNNNTDMHSHISQTYVFKQALNIYKVFIMYV